MNIFKFFKQPQNPGKDAKLVSIQQKQDAADKVLTMFERRNTDRRDHERRAEEKANPEIMRPLPAAGHS